MSHAAGVGRAVPARGRPGDAPAAGEHARARPQRLPAAARRSAARVPRARASTRSCPSRGASARPATSRRSPTSRCRSSAAARSSSAGTVVPALDRPARGRPRAARRSRPKEGLALLNGTQMMSAIGALLLADADRLVRTASVAAAMSVEALLGTDVAFAAAYQLARPHPGPDRGRRASCATCCATATLQRGHHGSIAQGPGPVLAALRARRSTARSATRSTTSAASSTSSSTRATDNPLVFPGGGVADDDALATGGGRVISGGNFHGEPIALALDFAKLALAELGSISERRTALLVDRAAQRRAAAVPGGGVGHRLRDDDLPVHGRRPRVARTRSSPIPASVDSIPTSANQEDHVSMGSIAARHARHGARARRADPRDRAARRAPRRSTCGWRQADVAGARGRGRRGARPDPRAGRAPRRGPRAGPGPRGGARLVHDGALADLAG